MFPAESPAANLEASGGGLQASLFIPYLPSFK